VIKIIKKLGPGLLFAGAAIGVSHLVQSTRAGADFGLVYFGLYYYLTSLNTHSFYLDLNTQLQLEKVY